MTTIEGRTVADALKHALRGAAKAYAPGDQSAPCALLWLDPERQWTEVVNMLRGSMRELCSLGTYNPEARTGPALWLRCVEARTVSAGLPDGAAPVLYIPGVSREQLQDLENIPTEITALAELQYRGALWLQANGKEWTPLAFLVAEKSGLGLHVPRDVATQDAVLEAMPVLLGERVSDLQGKVIDAKFLNERVAPDANGMILRWMDDPARFQERTKGVAWKAFCQQCAAEYHFDPVKDGALKAAGLLARRSNQWKPVWDRFAEAPTNYRGVVEWLNRAAPKNRGIWDTAEIWPSINAEQEAMLAAALTGLSNKTAEETARVILELEKQHGERRNHAWRALQLSPLACALEPLACLAALCAKPAGAPDARAYGDWYTSEGHRVDAAAVETMAACESLMQKSDVLQVLRILYLPWLEKTSRHLQQLLGAKEADRARRQAPASPQPGLVVLFADGLRFDVATRLRDALEERKLGASLDWDWAPLPTVTATAKPYCSPIASLLEPGNIESEFAPTVGNGQRLTQDRFLAQLESRGWQVLKANEFGDAEGSAWIEAGTLDKRGHVDGWKLAHAIRAEVRDLAERIQALLSAGWREVQIVTDHGWLMIPGGLPKVELKSFLAEDRWGRCATMKEGVATQLPEFPWHWNAAVRIAVPHGVGCFKSGMEYSHGGVSLQEMIVPRLTVKSGQVGTQARISLARWTQARCRITVECGVSGMTVDVRARLSDAASSFLADRKAVSLGADGGVSVFLEDDASIGKAATIILLDSDGQVIHSLATTLGVNP